VSTFPTRERFTLPFRKFRPVALESQSSAADDAHVSPSTFARRLGDWLGIEPDVDDDRELVRVSAGGATPDGPAVEFSAAYEAELLKLRDAIQELRGGLGS
jgi:hypothetical protein